MSLEASMIQLAESNLALAKAQNEHTAGLLAYINFMKNGGEAAPATDKAAATEKPAKEKTGKPAKEKAAAPPADDDGLGGDDDGLGGEAEAKTYTVDEVKAKFIEVRSKLGNDAKDAIFKKLGVGTFGQLEAKDYTRAVEFCDAALKGK